MCLWHLKLYSRTIWTPIINRIISQNYGRVISFKTHSISKEKPMNCFKTRSTKSCLPNNSRAHCYFLLLFFLCLVFISGPAAATQQNTVFLPIQVNSPDGGAELIDKVDSILNSIVSDKNYTMLDRKQTAALVDFSGTWPPPLKTLKQLAESTGLDYVAVGSLTVIGNQISLDYKVYDLLSLEPPKHYFVQDKSLDEIESGVSEIIGQVDGYTHHELIIGSIAPEGNKRTDSGAILMKIKTQIGDLYDPSTLRADLKAIHQMGAFKTAEIIVTDSPKGKAIVFKVVEKPVITAVRYKGTDEIDEDDVREAADFREQSILNQVKINRAVDNIRQLYKEKGYHNTKVTADVTFPDTEKAVLDFTIEEGAKTYIKEITFKGNAAFDHDDLEDVIETSEKGFFSWLTESGLIKMDMLRNDAAKIGAFYHNNGFLEAKVGEPIVQQKEEWLHITFVIQEGPRFKIGTIDFTGDLITEKEKLLERLSIRDETYLSRKSLREDILSLSDYYSEHGYAFAEFDPNIDKSASGKRLDIIFNIDKGDLVYINRIIISGNTRTRDNVIRRELAIEEGGLFDSKALRKSNQKLQRLSFFEEVNITPEPTADKTKMDIMIEIKEKPTGKFSIGGGYSSVDHLVFMAEISESNFLGRGDKLSLKGTLGGSSDQYTLSYTNPRLFDSQLSWGVDAFDMMREYTDYTKDSKGGALKVGYPIFEKWRAYFKYSLTDTELTDVDDDASYIIKESQGIELTSAIQLSLKRDTRDRLYGATKGSRHLLSVKYAGGPLQGDSEFTKVTASTSWYFPMFLKTVFHFKASAGQIFENETDKLPVYERFYLGGINSVRGFDYAGISPKDPVTAELIGGDKMWYANFEFIFPIAAEQGVNGVLFFDAGKVMGDDDSWGFSDYRTSVGIGLRWLSPMGPLRIEWGYNLDPEEGEDQSIWDFTIGGVF